MKTCMPKAAAAVLAATMGLLAAGCNGTTGTAGTPGASGSAGAAPADAGIVHEVRGRIAPWEFKGVPLDEVPAAFVKNVHPRMQDMQSWTELRPMLEGMLRSLRRQKGKWTGRVSRAEAEAALERLLELLPRLDREPELFLSEFEWIPLKRGTILGATRGDGIDARKQKDAAHSVPVCGVPAGLAGAKAADGGKWLKRGEIESGAAGRECALGWVHPADAWILQEEGRGRLVFPDGSAMRIAAAGANGYAVKPMRKTFQERSLDRIAAQGEDAMAAWLKANPGRAKAMYRESDGCVFFKPLENPAPIGMGGTPMRPWTSLVSAMPELPEGCIAAAGGGVPFPGGTAPLRFIGFVQDGMDRAAGSDLAVYSGASRPGAYAAVHMRSAGPVWALKRKARRE